jgi:hypothetical protein
MSEPNESFKIREFVFYPECPTFVPQYRGVNPPAGGSLAHIRQEADTGSE